ncbi:type IV secretory system conjugative DNA transfer family protein [Yinghuangia sp. YIM S09857]|uniref:type IV secretory system conjugative DNA transfer family protein n=1 Tax=Yinghuangia sp. YIM S09857 TaxID=3436929 RepID=UPI003F52AFB6
MPATLRRRGPSENGLPTVLALVLILAALGGMIAALTVRIGVWAALGVVAAIAAPVVVVAALFVRRSRNRPAIDRTARFLAQPRDLPVSTTRGVRASAARLGVESATPGVKIGRSVRGGRDVWGSWEDMHMDIWGPRTGKTATRAIPSVVAAPGAVVVTSNKRDVVDATRGVRERNGPVWVFDPQNQAGEPPRWWWDPLTFVDNSVPRAMITASLFASATRPAHLRSDGYFEPAGQDLFAALLLAASAAELPITDVLTWLRRPGDDTPARILRDAGHDLVADSVQAVLHTPAEQRAGVYGVAAQIASPLAAPEIARWVTPGEGPARPQFRHTEFSEHDNGTIYLLSEETNRLAAPLVLTLTSALAYAFEGRAIESRGGRLAVPAVFVLDEAANVCPWPELPSLYTHYGSRGIVMMTILQSWAQGVGVWGQTGMAAMWGAANVRVYGGGSADMGFLGDLSKISPRFEAPTHRVSWSGFDLFTRSVTRASRSEEVLDEAVLGAMPRGRAWAQLSGGEPVLLRTIPWWEGPYAGRIRDSIARYAPRPGGGSPPPGG